MPELQPVGKLGLDRVGHGWLDLGLGACVCVCVRMYACCLKFRGVAATPERCTPRANAMLCWCVASRGQRPCWLCVSMCIGVSPAFCSGVQRYVVWHTCQEWQGLLLLRSIAAAVWEPQESAWVGVPVAFSGVCQYCVGSKCVCVCFRHVFVCVCAFAILFTAAGGAL